MKKLLYLWVLAIVVMGCTTSQKGAAVGGITGATIGGIIGHQTDDDLTGAAIGGAVGTVGGMIIGEKLEKKFCPQCGKGYTEDVKFCPVDATELKYKE